MIPHVYYGNQHAARRVAAVSSTTSRHLDISKSSEICMFCLIVRVVDNDQISLQICWSMRQHKIGSPGNFRGRLVAGETTKTFGISIAVEHKSCRWVDNKLRQM